MRRQMQSLKEWTERSKPRPTNEAARVHIAARRCGGGVAHSPPAVRDAGDWLREQLASDHLRLCYRVSTGLERTGLVEGKRLRNRISLHRRSNRSTAGDRCRSGGRWVKSDSDARHGALRTTGAWSGERRTCRYLGFQAGTPGSHSTFFEPSLSLRRLRTRPARKPRTECCCQPVACIIAATVAPAGYCSMAMTRDCFEALMQIAQVSN